MSLVAVSSGGSFGRGRGSGSGFVRVGYGVVECGSLVGVVVDRGLVEWGMARVRVGLWRGTGRVDEREIVVGGH